jgi:predicted transposase/invertase (TIGR01784 family)
MKTIPEEFKESPEILRAIELAEESAYTKSELEAYDDYLDALRVEQTIKSDSYEEGREEGREEEREKNALNLLQLGMNPELISQAIGLTIERIKALEKDTKISFIG